MDQDLSHEDPDALAQIRVSIPRFPDAVTNAVTGGAPGDTTTYPPVAIQPGDRILLCSDGLTSVQDDSQKIIDATLGLSVSDAVDRLATMASHNRDNITIILVEIN